jgi:CheY-like chemotaxis protein
MRILVVDDMFESRWAVADWLVAFFEAVHVESVASGPEALATITHRKPDLVLAAHAMAGMDCAAREVATRCPFGPRHHRPERCAIRVGLRSGGSGFLARKTASAGSEDNSP